MRGSFRFTKKITVYFLATVMILSTATGATSAVLANEGLHDFFAENEIYFYTGTDADTPICGGSGFEDTGENLQTIYVYLKAKGLSDVQAGGALGNIWAESKGNPTATQYGEEVEDPSVFGTSIGVGKAWGIIQWDAGGRVIEYADQAGITTPIHLLETQLEILWWHMENSSPTGYTNMLENYLEITDIAEATLDFHQKIEGSSDDQSRLEGRIDQARIAVEKYSGISSVNPGVDCSTGGDGDIVGTSFEYAWPDERPRSNNAVMKPEYATAIERALSRGEFVGDPNNPGIDCGGFVTRVMRDSGVDPEYNKAQGNTSEQAIYLANNPDYIEVKPQTIDDLRPGDIGVRALEWEGGIGHTFIYVGENNYLDGARGDTVAASITDGVNGGLAPQTSWDNPLDSTYKMYRFVGTGDHH